MRQIIVGLGLLVLAVALLLWLYPWSIYYGNFTYARSVTLWSYIMTAAITTTIVVLVNALSQKIDRVVVRTISAGFLAFVSLAITALLFGPFGVTIPGTRVRGIFFSEWKFLTFITFIALPLSIIGAVLSNLWQRDTLAKSEH